MMISPPTAPSPPHVAVILEGTYPYVTGGVSTWVHQILGAYPSRSFQLIHIAAFKGAYAKPLYTFPPNVVGMHEIYCRGTEQLGRPGAPRIAPPPPRPKPSRVLAAIRRIHLGDVADDQLLADLDAGDLTIQEFLHGQPAFDLMRELYTKLCADAPFMDFFWQLRAMHIPLLRMLTAEVPEARVYHPVSCGYAGLLGAIASHRTGRPLVVTEHGIYHREREMELARATWISDRELTQLRSAQPSPLRRLWAHYFRMLSKIAYHRASLLVTLSDVNRAKQIADGADPAKILVVPNGVECPEVAERIDALPPREASPQARKLVIGFVGRIVPIKDVITLVKAIALCREQAEVEVWMIGPDDEDPEYAKRCRDLASELGLDGTIKWLGRQPMAQLYPKMDVLLLTSVGEGQPLVILEAYAYGVPAIVTDVGCCRELVEGGDSDRALGHSGICTRIASPRETAAAITRLAQDPELRARMGRAARARVTARYQFKELITRYESVYRQMTG